MIAEILLVLAGHDSSFFHGASVHPYFTHLLHPGEQQALEDLACIASRYRHIRSFCNASLNSANRYISALCSTLNAILEEEYEALVVDTEAKIITRNDKFVASDSFVPISSVRATFAPWDAPLKALHLLVDRLEEQSEWSPGPLIDLLLERANTGIHSISSLFSRLAIAVQQIWTSELSAFLVHGTVSVVLPLASEDLSVSSTFPMSAYILRDGAVPSCVSVQARESILYVGRTIATVKAAHKLSKKFPQTMAMEHVKLLDGVYPQDKHNFERVISEVRSNISEWLWLDVLTPQNVEDAVESLGDYFLLRNGEFCLALIRELETLKISRMMLNPSSRQIQMIREQDLHLAMLRASLGTSAQYDPALTRLRFILPSGPLRPLLPSLRPDDSLGHSQHTAFDEMLLGTQLKLTYNLPWPLDLFLTPAALSSYNSLFAFLSTVRKTHVRVLDSWVSLSNAQRARRRWTGTSEGGTEEDQEKRERLLRFAWGCARTMNWFLEVIMEYVWRDVVEEEFVKLKTWLKAMGCDSGASAGDNYLDFNSLRVLHNIYLSNLLNNTLVTQSSLSTILKAVFETCERFVAQIERWGGDILPPLLFEGSLAYGGGTSVGQMVLERWKIVKEINEKLTALLDTFYEQLSFMVSQPFATGGEALTRSFIANTTSAMPPSFVHPQGGRNRESFDRFPASDTRRHVERLLLHLDFSGGFSKPRSVFITDGISSEDILRQGGLA